MAKQYPGVSVSQQLPIPEDVRMLHYIFNEAPHLKSWNVVDIKTWLLQSKDPSLAPRISKMKVPQMADFVNKYPQYFQVIPSSNISQPLVILKPSTCLLCREPVLSHTPKKGTSPSLIYVARSSISPTSPTPPIAPTAPTPPTVPAPTIPLFSTTASVSSVMQPTTIQSIDIRMLHFIFVEAHPNILWHVSSIKPWLQLHYDPSFADRIHGMNNSQALAFLVKYPQHFSVIAGKGADTTYALVKESKCEYCGTPAQSHLGFRSAYGPPISAASRTQADREEARMLHYIFKQVAHTKTPWAISTVKSWLQMAPDPLLARRLQNMNGAQQATDFISKYPQHFEILPGTIAGSRSALLKDSECPHCGELASTHTSKNTPATTFSTTATILSTPATSTSFAALSTSTATTNATSVSTASATSVTPSAPPTTVPKPPTTTNVHSQISLFPPSMLPPFIQKSGAHNFGLVTTWEHCLIAVDYIRACPQIAVDCEGVDLSKTGKLCLIQVAAMTLSNEQCTFVFDIIALEKLPQIGQICNLLNSFLQDKNILKVMHDCRQDCAALFHQLNVSVANIFDSQIAYRVVCENKRGTHEYKVEDGRRIGLNALLQKYGFQEHPLKTEIHSQMEKGGSNFWTVRPLTENLIQYVVYDVVLLIPLMHKLKVDLQLQPIQAVNELSGAYSRSYIEEPISLPSPNCLQELTFTATYSCEYRETVFSEYVNELPTNDFTIDEDTLSLASLLPTTIQLRALQKSLELRRDLIEVVLDHERPVSLRFSGIDEVHLEEEADITEALKCLSESISTLSGSKKPIKFMSDNRLGISKMLHRISALRSRSGDIIGLTYRIGRSVEGVSYMVQDLIAKIAGFGEKKPSSVLFLGPPGVGKTTVLREVARVLSSEFKKRVVVVDTSNEIAGDGDIPHTCIGRARRVQIPHRNEQHAVLIETVQNHNPQVIIVDEIGTSQEVEAVKTITQRGVAMVGTAHGEDLHTLLKNPTLRGLIGGVQQVILSAAEAKMLNKDNSAAYKKSRLERAGAPTFDIVVELRKRHKWRIYTQVGDIIDKLLANMNPLVETRVSSADKKIFAVFSEERSKEDWFETLLNPAS